MGIEYKGIIYPTRVAIDNEGSSLLIADTNLYDALHPYEWGANEYDGFADETAMRIDEGIFFYVSKGDLDLPEKEFIQELAESNPDFFN